MKPFYRCFKNLVMAKNVKNKMNENEDKQKSVRNLTKEKRTLLNNLRLG